MAGDKGSAPATPRGSKLRPYEEQLLSQLYDSIPREVESCEHGSASDMKKLTNANLLWKLGYLRVMTDKDSRLAIYLPDSIAALPVDLSVAALLILADKAVQDASSSLAPASPSLLQLLLTSGEPGTDLNAKLTEQQRWSMTLILLARFFLERLQMSGDSSASSCSPNNLNDGQTSFARIWQQHPFQKSAFEAKVAVACALIFAEMEIEIPVTETSKNQSLASSPTKPTVASPRNSPNAKVDTFSGYANGIWTGLVSGLGGLVGSDYIPTHEDSAAFQEKEFLLRVPSDMLAVGSTKVGRSASKDRNQTAAADPDLAALLKQLLVENIMKPLSNPNLKVRHDCNFRFMADNAGINPVERFFYFTTTPEKKFFPAFAEKLTCAQLKYVVATWCAGPEFSWARENVPPNFFQKVDTTKQKCRFQPAKDHVDKDSKNWIGEATYKMCEYRADNREGKNIHVSWAAFYHNRPVTLQNMCETGGVCGTVSRVGTGLAQSFGVPAVCVAQPGHCAFLALKEATSLGTAVASAGSTSNSKFFWCLRNGNSSRLETTRHDNAHLTWREQTGGRSKQCTVVALVLPKLNNRPRDDVAPWRMQVLDWCVATPDAYLQSENCRALALWSLKTGFEIMLGNSGSSIKLQFRTNSNRRPYPLNKKRATLEKVFDAVIRSVLLCPANYYAWLLYAEFFTRILPAIDSEESLHFGQKLYDRYYKPQLAAMQELQREKRGQESGAALDFLQSTDFASGVCFKDYSTSSKTKIDAARTRGKPLDLFDGTDSEFMTMDNSCSLLFTFKQGWKFSCSGIAIKWWGFSRARDWTLSVAGMVSNKDNAPVTPRDPDFIPIASSASATLIDETRNQCNEWSVVENVDFRVLDSVLPPSGVWFLRLDMKDGKKDPWNMNMLLGLRKIKISGYPAAKAQLGFAHMPRWFCENTLDNMYRSLEREDQSFSPPARSGTTATSNQSIRGQLMQESSARLQSYAEDFRAFKNRVLIELSQPE
ncbi:unnamed protein product [Amoebophrya sp. A120]|nr:unnamed protein product [Amoebophrya sp. A120]|eukprot:GSA120T00006615001.1